MPQHKIVSQSEWTAQRKAFLAREKEFTRARDRLSAERRALPWVKVEKPYVFETPAGKKTLAELFDGKSQLIVYHFMLGPGWVEGCPSCSTSPTISMVQLSTCPSATRRSSWSPARLSPRSRPTKSAWAGNSDGSPRSAATSTSTIRSRFAMTR